MSIICHTDAHYLSINHYRNTLSTRPIAQNFYGCGIPLIIFSRIVDYDISNNTIFCISKSLSIFTISLKFYNRLCNIAITTVGNIYLKNSTEIIGRGIKLIIVNKFTIARGEFLSAASECIGKHWVPGVVFALNIKPNWRIGGFGCYAITYSKIITSAMCCTSITSCAC